MIQSWYAKLHLQEDGIMSISNTLVRCSYSWDFELMCILCINLDNWNEMSHFTDAVDVESVWIVANDMRSNCLYECCNTAQYFGYNMLAISTLDATSYIHKTTFGPDLIGSALTSNGKMSNISLSTIWHIYIHLLHKSSIRTDFDKGLKFWWKVRNATYPKYNTFGKNAK